MSWYNGIDLNLFRGKEVKTKGENVGVFKPGRCSYRSYGVQRRRSLHFDLGIPIDYHLTKHDSHGIDDMNLERSETM